MLDAQIHTLQVTSRRLAGGQEQRSLATWQLIKYLPGRRQFYHTNESWYFEVKTICQIVAVRWDVITAEE